MFHRPGGLCEQAKLGAIVVKAIRVHKFGGPEVLQFEEVPTPSPGPGQVLLQVRAVGVNPVETYLRAGMNPDLKLPWTPGLDAAGVIEVIGEDVPDLRSGDRVYTSNTVTGSYAQFVICEAQDVHALPSQLSFPQGAAINTPYATAYRALLQRGRARAEETVLVHGASGGVGVAATQIARQLGMKILGTAGTEAGRRLAAENGADHVLDHTKPGYLESALELTAGRGVDIILEMLANVNLGSDLKVLATRGRVVIIGSRGDVQITPRDLMKRDAEILGVMLYNTPAKKLQEIHVALGAGLEQGQLRPVVGREMTLAEAARAHVAVLEPGAHGKIVLKPTS
jgi:NADPH2:quinone reductase